MSGNFSIGDIVIVSGRQNGMEFFNTKGVVVNNSSLTQLVGIDFSSSDPSTYRAAVDYDYGTNCFHDLSGRFPGQNHYYWVDSKLIKKRTKTKTGFGRFIERIENV